MWYEIEVPFISGQKMIDSDTYSQTEFFVNIKKTSRCKNLTMFYSIQKQLHLYVIM